MLSTHPSAPRSRESGRADKDARAGDAVADIDKGCGRGGIVGGEVGGPSLEAGEESGGVEVAGGVVVELDEDVVDGGAHGREGDGGVRTGTLRRGGQVVGFLVGGEVGAEGGDQGGPVEGGAVLVVYDRKEEEVLERGDLGVFGGNGRGRILTDIESIKDKTPKWSDGHDSIIVYPACAEQIPDIICDPHGILLTRNCRFTIPHSTTNTQQTLLSSTLAVLDLL